MRRLQKITLKKFRSHRHTVLPLERVTFVRGLNKSGKSSVAMGVAMVLSGRCDVTDEGGKGFEELIEEGAQNATVALTYDDDLTLSLVMDRTAGRTYKVETPQRTILGKQAQQWIAENIAPPDVVSAALNAW